MDIKVRPGRLSGEVKAPPSKSMAHRALICGALTSGTCRISGISGSKDMEATMGCMRALGAVIEQIPGTLDINITGIFAPGNGKTGRPDGEQPPLLDCIESGSTLRFILPVAAALGQKASFTGRGKLPERPMTPLADEMKKKGIVFSPDGRDSLPFTIEGQLQPGVYEIPGNISSQYISGLIFALPLLKGDSQIRIIGKLESAGYIALTLQMVRDFGIDVAETDYGFSIRGGQTYRASDTEVEGDYSNAAFWMAAAACGSDLTVTGLRADSAQGDRKAAAILAQAGADVSCSLAAGPYKGNSESGNMSRGAEAMPYIKMAELAENGRLPEDRRIVSFKIDGSSMQGISVDSHDIPDIVPILSVAAAAASGTTLFYDAGRLRIKESDRLAAMSDCLTRLGCTVRESEEELEVTGGSLQGGCSVSGYNDHRIVMSMAIAALMCREPVIIEGAEAVTKSYPDFFDEFRRLGGRADVITDR